VLSDGAVGAVWRLQTDEGDATGIRGFESDEIIVNMSVWESIDELAEFVYRSGHVAVMRRRRQWFERLRHYMALWWVPAGHAPSLEEAEVRLQSVREHGPTPFAFTFNKRFSPSEALLASEPVDCPA
jgi:hypothetical protein